MKRNEKEGEYNLMQRFKGENYKKNKEYIDSINNMAEELRDTKIENKLKQAQEGYTESKEGLEKYLKYLNEVEEKFDKDKLGQFITFVFKKETPTSTSDVNLGQGNYEFKLNLKF